MSDLCKKSHLTTSQWVTTKTSPDSALLQSVAVDVLGELVRITRDNDFRSAAIGSLNTTSLSLKHAPLSEVAELLVHKWVPSCGLLNKLLPDNKNDFTTNSFQNYYRVMNMQI